MFVTQKLAAQTSRLHLSGVQRLETAVQCTLTYTPVTCGKIFKKIKTVLLRS